MRLLLIGVVLCSWSPPATAVPPPAPLPPEPPSPPPPTAPCSLGINAGELCVVVVAEVESRFDLLTKVLAASVAGLLLLAAIVVAVCRGWSRRDQSAIFVFEQTGKPPRLHLAPELKWHLFLSHTWKSGQDQARTIKLQLVNLVVGLKCFLDVDDLEDIERLEAEVCAWLLCVRRVPRHLFVR